VGIMSWIDTAFRPMTLIPRLISWTFRAPLVRRGAIRLSDRDVARRLLDAALAEDAKARLARRAAKESARRNGRSRPAPQQL
jgi:hypothetical protein